MIEHFGTQREARSQGRAPLLLVSKQNLNPSSWHITLTILKNGLEMRKLKYLEVKRVKNSKKQTIEHYKDQFPNIQKILCMLFYCD
jgi:hypothetical protein